MCLRSAAGDTGDDAQAVARVDAGVQPVQKTNVFLAEEDVDEVSQLLPS